MISKYPTHPDVDRTKNPGTCNSGTPATHTTPIPFPCPNPLSRMGMIWEGLWEGGPTIEGPWKNPEYNVWVKPLNIGRDQKVLPQSATPMTPCLIDSTSTLSFGQRLHDLRCPNET